MNHLNFKPYDIAGFLKNSQAVPVAADKVVGSVVNTAYTSRIVMSAGVEECIENSSWQSDKS